MEFTARLFLSGLCFAALVGVLGARSKYLSEPVVTGTHEEIARSLKQTAQRLSEEIDRREQEKLATFEQKKQAKLKKIALEKQKKEEQALQEKLARMVRSEKKRLAKKLAQEKHLLQGAKLFEEKRRKRITSWRDFFSTKRAAAVLIKEAEALDMSNKLHVEELSCEVKRFANDRLRGSLKEYPELEWLARL